MIGDLDLFSVYLATLVNVEHPEQLVGNSVTHLIISEDTDQIFVAVLNKFQHLVSADALIAVEIEAFQGFFDTIFL